MKQGQETTDLAAVDWAQHLAQPIGYVREILGLGEPPSYTRMMLNPNGRGIVPEPSQEQVPAQRS